MTKPAMIPAVSVAVVHEGRVLLVRRGREPSKGLHAFPGGKVEPGEASETAARRELLEETGLTVGLLTAADTFRFETGRPDGAVYALQVFVAADPVGTPVAGDDAETVGWFAPHELSDLPITQSTLAVALRLLGHALP